MDGQNIVSISLGNVPKKLSPRKKSPMKDRYSSFLKNKKSREPKQNAQKRYEEPLVVVKKKYRKKKKIEKRVEKPVDKRVEKPVVLKKNKSRRQSVRRRQRTPLRKSKLAKKHKSNRKVSFKCTPRKKTRKLNTILKESNKLSDDKIKEKLLENGIELKSNNTKLLRDLYMFSELGGISIHKN